MQVSEEQEFLKSVRRDQSSVFPEISLTCWSKCTANSIFRKNVTYLVEFFRCAVRLVENQLINTILSLTVKNIVTIEETIHAMCSRDNIIQSRESVETDQSDRILGNMRIVLSFFRQWGSGTIFLLFSFLRNILQLGFAEFLENINDIICTIDFHGIRRLAAFKRSKFGKTGIQFFRIFYFGCLLYTSDAADE